MGSQLMTIILIVLVGFIIFSIYSIVKMHDRALKLSQSEDVEKYLQREEERLQMVKKKIARAEKQMNEVEEIEEVAKNELESETEMESETVENEELLEKLEELIEE